MSAGLRRCGHPLGQTSWCPDCELAEARTTGEFWTGAVRKPVQPQNPPIADVAKLDVEGTRGAFEDSVRDFWTIGYRCPRFGEGYENVHVNAMWAIWKKALSLRASAPPAGHCDRNGGCVCGGDTQRVREGCSNWVKGGATCPR